MASLRNALKTSPQLEKDGIWLERGNTKVKLRRAGGTNTAFNMAMANVMNEYGSAIKHNLLSNEKANEILYETFAEHVVVDWQTNVGTEIQPEWITGIEGATEGETLPVTFDNIVAYWRDVPAWFIECKETAENIQFYRQALVAKIAGN